MNNEPNVDKTAVRVGTSLVDLVYRLRCCFVGEKTGESEKKRELRGYCLRQWPNTRKTSDRNISQTPHGIRYDGKNGKLILKSDQ